MKRIILFFVIAIGITAFLNSCSKEYSFEKANPVGDAVFSFKDSLGNCLSDTVHGTFYNGVAPGTDTAYVEVQVRVDSIGNYKIYTDNKNLQNGFMFADSGYFSTTGYTTIKLKPIGQPILHTPTPFSLTSDSSACGFTIYVQDSTGTGLGGSNSNTDSLGTWEFSTDSGGYFHGFVNFAAVAIDSTVWRTNGKLLAITGLTQTKDSVLTLIAYLPGGVITPGNYNSQLDPPDSASIFGFNFVSTGDPIYDAVSGQPSNVTLTISSYDSNTHLITGTFSGPAIDAVYSTEPIINIVNGKFTATVTP